jgi:hypothetical protein
MDATSLALATFRVGGAFPFPYRTIKEFRLLAGGLADAKRVSTAFSVSGLFPKLTE